MRRSMFGIGLLLLAMACDGGPEAIAPSSAVADNRTSVTFEEVAARQRAAAEAKSAKLAMDVLARNDAAATPLTQHWKEFRRTFPFHTQVLALSGPAADGTRTLIVSEPPPHVKTADILVPLAVILRRHELQKQVVGFDGNVTDVVVAVAGSEEEIAAALSELNRRLFFTSYKAYVLRLPVQATKQRFDLDLDVSAAEIRKWLLDDAERFSPLEGGDAVPATAIFQSLRSIVHHSSARGLVTWWIPSGTLLDSVAVQAREFALESDLVIGAVGNQRGTLVVARERVVPVDFLPPLRFETMALLASAQSASNRELQQSYERNARFAGRFNKDRDWAPILLSPELRDTEYGSLLNITDQLLKGWSNGGMTEYVNFAYPRPPSYPFARPLPFQLQATELTYNWNTTGAAYAVASGDTTLLALNRSGALPVSYIPGEGDGDEEPAQATLQAEETAYKYFSQLSDPNLVRVVQYAALYQIFTAFDVRNKPIDTAAGQYASKRLEQLTEQLTREIENASADELQKLASAIAPTYAKIFGLPEAFAALQARVLLSAFKEQPGEPTSIQVQTLLSLVAGERDLPRRYAEDVAKHSAGWIHTPVVVVSWNDVPNAVLVGGHNLRAEVTNVREASDIAKGGVKVGADGSILVNPADASRMRSLVRSAARLRNKPPEVREAMLARMLQKIRETKPRPIIEALQFTSHAGARARLPMPEPPQPGSARRVGWNTPDLPVGDRPRERASAARITVDRRGDVYVIHLAGLPPREAFTKPDVTDAIVNYLREGGGEDAVAIDLRNFEEHEAIAFVRECEVQAGRGRNGKRPVSALLHSDTAEVAVARLEQGRFDFARAKVQSSVRETVERYEAEWRIEVPRSDHGAGLRTTIGVTVDKAVPKSIFNRIVSMVQEAISRIVTGMRGQYDAVLFNYRLNQAIKRIRIETGVDFELILHQFGDSAGDVRIVSNGGEFDEIASTDACRAA